MDLSRALNPAQCRAAQHTDGPLLILAGAGSGKTRVITHRAAHLIDTGRARAEQILAVTFTNKAAGEMRERVDELLVSLGRGRERGGVTLSTFHALGARLMRRHARRLRLTYRFQIYDTADTQRLARDVLRAAQRDSTPAHVRRALGYVDRMKNRGLTPEGAHELSIKPNEEEGAFFYEAYQDALREANCVDFGDLILGPLEIMRADPALARRYSEQWRYLMVDEFQDTNPAQYELLRHLTVAHDNLTVVGDDDQAIYRWRGATVANILGFERDFPGAEVVKLEQNYRSTQLILDAANDVIRHNPDRREKTLWTESAGGDPIRVFTAHSGREEAAWVAQTIGRLAASERADWSSFSVFFRINAQARLFEEQLRYAGVPYVIVGGVSFYQREEIKDLLAYFKVALNPTNSVDLLRVLNVPSRSLGAKSAERLTDAAHVPGVGSVWAAARLALGEADPLAERDGPAARPAPESGAHHDALEALAKLRPAQKSGLLEFVETIETLRDDLLHFDELADAVRSLLEHIHYGAHLKTKHQETAEDRARNVAELISAVTEFDRDFEPDPDALAALEDPDASPEDLLARTGAGDAIAARKLSAFLERSALITQTKTDDGEDEASAPRVTLMTVHGSKGLEFDYVFLAGMEDELFPSLRDLDDPEELAEERRLAYVAITRAKQRLYLTNARRRRVFGNLRENSPSRFLLDIDADRIEVDAQSSSREVDWRARSFHQTPMSESGGYGRQARRARPSFDEVSQAPAPEAAFARPNYDEFSQLPADEWTPAGDADDGVFRPGTSDDLVGKTVTHTKFGVGEVLKVSGIGPKANVTVRFPGRGQKTIVRRFLRAL